MGYKVFQCVICGKEVSRRKSISLKELDGRDGRACKEHPEVMKIIQDRLNEAEMRRQCEEAAKALRVIAAASFIRVMHTVRGVNPEAIYFNFRMNGMPESTIRAIKEEVEKRGGPRMSNDEILDSLIAYSSFLKFQRE